MRIFLVIVLSVITCNIYSQDLFHRTYKHQQDTALTNLYSTSWSTNQFLVLNAKVYEEDTTKYSSLIVSYLDRKGNINWSREIIILDKDSIIASTKAQIMRLDTIILISFTLDNTEKFNKYVTILDLQGQLRWSKVLETGNMAENEFVGPHLIAEWINESFQQVCNSGTSETDGPIMVLNRINFSGQIESASGYNNEEDNSDLLAAAVYTRQDSFTYITGLNDIYAFLAVLDVSGNPFWARRFNEEKDSSITNVSRGLDVSYSAVDSAFYVLTESIDYEMSMQELVEIRRGNNLYKIDFSGEIDWVYGLETMTGSQEKLSVQKLISATGGGVVISGIVTDESRDSSYYFMSQIRSSGVLDWAKKYNKLLAYTGGGTNVFNASPDGMFLSGTGIQENGQIVPSMINTDSRGSSSCEEEYNLILTQKDSIQQDLIINRFAMPDTKLGDIEVEVRNFTRFRVPELSLGGAFFCMKDTIDYTFFARTTPPGVEYIWGDGSTADTLRVFDVGNYTVTVTYDEEICFMLCDTGFIKHYDLPFLSLGAGPGNFCQNGLFTVSANIQAQAGIQSIEWSTGQSGTNLRSIEIPSGGVYSVTVTDNCDEVAIGQITVDPFPVLVESFSVTPQIIRDECNDLLIAYSVSVVPSNSEYQSIVATNLGTGATISAPPQSININSPGTWSISVFDFCGEEQGPEVNAQSEKNFFPIDSIRIDSTYDCIARQLTLTAVLFPEPPSTNVLRRYEWISTRRTVNEASIIIDIDKLKDFEPAEFWRFIVEDECGTDHSEEFNLLRKNFDPLQWPKLVLLLPDAQVINQSFGPYRPGMEDEEGNQIPDVDILTYDLKVFNRWGQEVFSSTNIDREWNGRYEDGRIAPLDTYVWYVNYTYGDGCSVTRKGDVTLLR